MPSPALPEAPRAFDRAAALRRLGERHFDVVVVGGGVTGAGVALDAAARGLRTALVEARDLGSGTSSASSKMVHGGLRYLQSHDYHLVHEALVERHRLLRNAPHLVRPLPFLIPLFGKPGGSGSVTVAKSVAKAYSTALWLYDLVGGWRIGHRHRRISADAALGHVPLLRTDRLVASFLYWDAQADDARLTLALARTAAVHHGATIATWSPVVAILADGGRARGVRLADGTEVSAEVVVNAGGVWSAEIDALGPAHDGHVALRPAKGVHVTVPADRLPCDTAAVLAVPGDKRSVFVVPWDLASAGFGRSGRFTYIGTTDTAHDGPLDTASVTPADVEYLLGAVNHWTSAELTPADVSGSWAGLRPLVSGASTARTADLSRRHLVATSPAGVITVTGGKLTTYRLMAAEAVDAVIAQLGGRHLSYSPTRRLPLWGADGWEEVTRPDAARRLGLPEATVAHLAGRYGGEARAVAALVAADPELGAPLVPGLAYLRAEAVFAARHEMAHTLLDVLQRRTRAWLLDRRATVAAAKDVATLVGDELGWSDAQRAAEVAAVRAAGAAEDAALTSTPPLARST